MRSVIRNHATQVSKSRWQDCPAGHPADDAADADVSFQPAPVPVLQWYGDPGMDLAVGPSNLVPTRPESDRDGAARLWDNLTP